MAASCQCESVIGLTATKSAGWPRGNSARYIKAMSSVPPQAATIAGRQYPLTAEVYAVVRADTPADSTATLLRDWLLGAEGQRTVADSGYVPLAVE